MDAPIPNTTSRPAGALLDRLPVGVPAWLRRPRAIALAVGVAAVAAVVAVIMLRPPSGPAPALTLPQAGAEPAGPSVASATTPTTVAGVAATGAAPAPSSMVTAHAAGDVVSPGVYVLPAGARVADLLSAAGGPQPDADLDRLNLAARVADGDRVYVPRRGEVVPPDVTPSVADPGSGGGGGGPPTSAVPLDLNTATAEQLDALPGVGPATAQAIITYRTNHGRFRSVTDLLNVPGIGPAKLEAVRSLVRV